jgi:hypothetical protein
MIYSNVKAKLSFIGACLFFFSSNIISQSECRSIIGAHINPISKDSTLGLGLETVVGLGYIDSNPIANFMAIGAFDFTSKNKNHRFYIEGVGKYWSKFHGTPGKGKTAEAADTTETSESSSEDKKYVGMREAFYMFNHLSTTLKAGIQTTTTGDYYLVDERVLGFKAIQQIHSFQIQAMVATTNRDLARMQNVCGVKPLYNVLKNKLNINQVGVNTFETNFFNTTLKWEPGKVSAPAASSSADEFETTDEFSEIKPNNKFTFNELGIIYYQEFGTGFNTNRHYIGAFSSINLLAGIELKLEAMRQFVSNNNVYSYMAELDENFVWKSNANTNINIGYMGKLNIDTGAVFMPAFTNLFLGEVARLDAFDLPAYYGSIKHTFPIKFNPHLRLRFVGQEIGNNTKEFDVEAGFKFSGHAKFTGIYSLISSNLVQSNINMFRLEIRYAF